MEQLAGFKQFLNNNFSDLGMISLITAGCVIVLSFALREIASWMTKTDQLRSEVRRLNSTLYKLEDDIARLHKLLEAQETPSASKETPKVLWATVKTEASQKDAFPLN